MELRARVFAVPVVLILGGVAFAAVLTPCISLVAAGSNAPPAAPRLIAPGVVSTEANEFGPALTPDGKTLFFCRTAPGRSNYQAILVSRKQPDGSWGEPETAPFSGEWNDIDPSISPDGKTLVFASTRPVVRGVPKRDYDLWAVGRTETGWSEPRHLGDLVNSPQDESTTSIAEDGTLTLASTRAGGRGGRDLYTSRLLDGVYQVPLPIPALNTEHDDSNAFVTPDGSILVFGSNRPGGPGALFEFYVSRRGPEGWSAPVKLAVPANGGASVLTPLLSPDRRTFLFASFRGFADAPIGRRLSVQEMTERFRAPGNGLGDLYEVDAVAVGLAK
jgi:hypothetical protein